MTENDGARIADALERIADAMPALVESLVQTAMAMNAQAAAAYSCKALRQEELLPVATKYVGLRLNGRPVTP